MRRLRAWLLRFSGLFNRQRHERELIEEIDLHLAEHVADKLIDGMTLEQAQRDAMMTLGGIELTKQRLRDRRRLSTLDTLTQDLRYAVRVLRRSPGLTFAAIASLAVGVGANTAIFSVVNAVLLKPVPYAEPDRVVMFVTASPDGSRAGGFNTHFALWRQYADVFEDVSAYRFDTVNVTGGAHPEQISAARVTADFFRLFNARASEGRTFTSSEARPGGEHVVVLSAEFWQRRFGRDPQLVGKTVSLDGDPHVVIGILSTFDAEILQPRFGRPDVWMPLRLDTAPDGVGILVAGRMAPYVTLSEARARLQPATDEYRRRFPTGLGPRDHFSVEPFRDVIVRDARSSLLILVGAVSLVLLTAIANVANLLLARASDRTREIALRAAIGASRGRLIRQLLTESVLLSALGSVLGLIVGAAAIRALLAMNPGNVGWPGFSGFGSMPRLGDHGSAVTTDWRVIAFTVGLSMMTGILAGFIPALQASRGDLIASLKRSTGSPVVGARRITVRSFLVIGEMSVAVLLVIGAMLLMRTFINLQAVAPGFDARNVLTLRMSLAGTRFERTSSVNQLIRVGTERIKSVPGVDAVGASCCLPLVLGDSYGVPFTIVGRPPRGASPYHGGGNWTFVSPGYFDALKIPLIRGRSFSDRDDAGAPGVVVISQLMARTLWTESDPLLGQLLIDTGSGLQNERPRQIVGIAGDIHDFDLSRRPYPAMYTPVAQLPDGVNATLMKANPIAWIVRTSVTPHAVSSAIQRELEQASSGFPVARIRSMDEVVRQSTTRTQFNVVLMMVFGGSALLLAAIGIYGVMAYLVQQRTQEIGIRRALGAASHQVRNMMLVNGMRPVLLGVLIGVASAFGLTRVLASVLFGVTPHDRLVFISVPLMLSAVAFVAAWLPAREVARIDPAVALRCD